MSPSSGGHGEGPMRVVERAAYRGPNIYSLNPMVRVRLDLRSLEAWPTDRLDGFTDRLVAMAPGLMEHGCSYGEAGGLLRRMREGTWLGHVIEHLALELQTRAGHAVSRGKTRSVKDEPGVYDVLVRYEEGVVAFAAVRLAVQVVDCLLPAELRGAQGLDRIIRPDEAPGVESAHDVDTALRALAPIARRAGLGPSTRGLVQAARSMGVPVLRLDAQSLVQLGWGANQRRIRASVTDRTGLIAAEAAGDKSLTKRLLDEIGVPVARGEVVRSADEAVRAARRLRLPVVTKPLDGNHGRGVSLGLKTEEEVRAGFEAAARHSRRVVIEEQLRGRDYRILVIDGRVAAVAERTPAQVTGDGVSTVAELIEQINADPRRGDGHANIMTRIKVDEAIHALLAESGLTLDSVPARGVVVPLRSTANLSTGGTAIDRTDEIHPENAMLARRAALAVGLDVAGIDLLAPDITRPVRETGGGVVEVNAAPGLRMHLAPSEGRPRDVGRDVVRMLFPRGAHSRIPVLAVTGTNGKSTVGRMLSHIFASQGRTVGLTNTSGVYVGGCQVWAGDASGPRSARMVLRDPTVEVAVMECARGGILREGLAFDRCDVGAVLNIQPDHLGLKGVNSLEDLADAKSVVVEAVSRRGVSVLNGDDPMTIRMARHAGGRVCWFSTRGGPDAPGFLQKHLAEGGMAVLTEPGRGGEMLVLYDRGARTELLRAADIPATLGGRARFNVLNAMAAVGMAYGAGLKPDAIAQALTTFASTFEQNPGRMNVLRAHDVTVILDYAHNPEALRNISDLVRRMRDDEGGRVIGMVSIPGDRRDQDILQMGEIAAGGFDVSVFRETPDGRGRPYGQITALMAEGALKAGAPEDAVHKQPEEDEAVRCALALARPGDVVVLMPTRVEHVWRMAEAWAAAPRPFPPAEDSRRQNLHG